MKNVEELMPLISSSMRATGNYVYSRISHLSGKEAYALAMKECIDYIDFYGIGELESLKDNISNTRCDIDKYYPISFFKSNKTQREFYFLACDNAEEIVNNLEKRFITGYLGTDTKFFNMKGIYLYENKSIF